MHSNYNKVSETSMPVDEVEAWLDEFEHKRAENKPNGGIIRSTATIVFTDGARANRTKREKQQARAQAQREHKAAMRELAVQDRKDQVEIARKRKVWAKEIKAMRRQQKPKSVSRIEIMGARKDTLEARLRNGEHIAIPDHKTAKSDYDTMRRDILAIKKRFTNGIVRLKCLDSNQSYYAIDAIDTFNSNINYSEMESVVAALKTKKSVRINGDMYQEEVKSLASMVRKIDGVTGIYGLDNTAKGWVML